MLHGHEHFARHVAWSPHARWLISGGHDGVVRIPDRNTRQAVARLAAQSGPVWSVRFLPLGNRIASLLPADKAIAWDSSSLGKAYCRAMLKLMLR